MRRDEVTHPSGDAAHPPESERETDESAPRLAELGGQALDVDSALTRALGEPAESLREPGELLEGHPEDPQHDRRREREHRDDQIGVLEPVIGQPRTDPDRGERGGQAEQLNRSGDR